jgi:copper transport protein
VRRARRLGVVLVLTAAVVAGLATAAQAHALLKRADPADGSTVSKAPRSILMFFTEPPTPSLSVVGVLNSSGQTVKGIGPPVAVASGTNEMSVTVAAGSMPDGVYTVTWRTVSKTDGHVTAGSFSFGIGVPAGSVHPTGTTKVPTTPPPSPTAVAGRWLLYWGVAILFGAAAVGWAVLGWRLPRGAAPLLWGAWAAAAVGVVLMTIAERVTVGLPIGAVLSSPTGHQLIGEGVAVLLCGAAVVAVVLRPARATLVALGLLTAAELFVHAQAGHADAASSVRILNLLDQWIHLLAVAAWIGGLPWLLLGLRGATSQERRERAARFSAMATIAVVLVVATGILRAIPEVGSLHGLLHTSFGHTLLIKSALVALLLGLGAINKFRLVPAMQKGDTEEERAGARLRRSVGTEIVVAALILGVTAVLSQLAPASYVAAAEKASAPQQVTVGGSDFATTVKVLLTVSPGTVGENTFTTRITDFDSGAPVHASSVQLQFSFPNNPNVASTLQLHGGANGVWTGRGTDLSIDGPWTIVVLIQTPTASTDVTLHLRTRLPPEQITAQAASGQPTIYTIQLGGGLSLQTYVEPGTKGPNTVHYTFFQANGNEEPISKATASSESPSGTQAPMPLIRFDPGHFAANTTLTPGIWTFFIQATTQSGRQLSAYFRQTIAS